jgi:SAM-dependent methyltransferase
VHPLETYLKSLAEIRASAAGTKETSYYPAFHALLNEAGSTLKPKVRCILQLANRGAGNPDGGLYTAEQFQKLRNEEPTPGQKPARGAIEIKAPKDDAWVTAASEQATKYWREYGQVLVSNYRDFVLIGRDAEGKPLKLASYRLAPDEKSFWKLAAQPHKCAKEQGERFLDFLKLAMLSPAILTEPKDVAWVLAYYAREAKFRIEGQAELEALAAVREALEQALGLKFEGEKGEHFFRSSLVQTLFYGVFSAWVLWSKQHPPASKDKFDWKLAQWSLRVPMIRALFEQVATPGQLGALGLVEVLDWTAAALNRVNRGEFFAQFQEQEAVQYFYEPFLEAFDPELRKELGVWYTPLEIVKYMVARTDRVLREELGLEDGLADENVYVLDPGCGTGAYLVEVLKTIAATLKAKGDDALAAQAVKQAARERVFGFEILPAPFVISHLQLGLLLQNLGAPLAEKGGERVGVFLTNSLTGWEPPKGPKQHLIFPEMEAERDLAENVKQDKPILVVIGNPPYNAFAGVSPAEEEGLVEPYKEGLISEWGIKKFNLDDLYVRFFRLAERRIAEKTGKGVVCYISNFSYLGGPSFVVMRRRFLEEFDRLWFDCMNGDSRETGKVTPDGKPDPSVFSTQMNPEGIRVGTAVGLMVRGKTRQPAEVRFRNFWGTTKRTDLLNSLACEPFEGRYEKVESTRANRFSFRPGLVTPEYMVWPQITELCAVPPSNGLMEKRGGALIDIDKNALQARMEAYFDKRLNWTEYKALGYGLTKPQARFDPKKAREKALELEGFSSDRLVRYAIRPFDVQWCYYTGIRPVWNEPRPVLWPQVWKGNSFVLSRFKAEKDPEGPPFYFTPCLSDDHLLAPDAVAIPALLKANEGARRADLFGPGEAAKEKIAANLSERAKAYCDALEIDDDARQAQVLWVHAVAIGFSRAYLNENADGIRSDWPRIPLPATKELLLASAALGEELAALLNTEAGVHGVTSGKLRAEMKAIGNVSALGGKTLDASELNITAGWGHGGKDGATMPGKGKLVERDYTESEREAIAEGAQALGLTLEEALAQLGETTCDVYLNENAYWRNVPSRVWEYTIGGYQVMKKWLSYREAKLLGRSITPEEAHYVRDMARRIAGICLLQPKLDGNYAAVKANAYVWGERAAAPNTETAKQ